ncbi:MAG: magnesium/cobalt transporter CorA [Thauera phenolivorans]|uniref:Magnesium transport protein CorA n=1 Tax=Thauera phenolivorans TaxID=1792543 RepID=A0A7X7R867_9RHOO|nr:magnesium/cobalt transporter CorA [Thauera phenolivorans]NLF54269.1 magnesium/cobalt transporter CorA [Thauera phenolivorans]
MLMNCVAYQGGRKLADIAVSEIKDYLARPECFVWVGLNDASADELARMQEEFGLHELAVEDAVHGRQRPKVEEYEDGLFVAMRLLEDKGGALVVGELNVFVGTNYLLSVRRGRKQDLRAVRARCERDQKMLARGAGYVLYALMDAVVDSYLPMIETLQTELEALEERIFIRGAASSNVRRLYKLKRKLAVLKHAVAPLMEATAKLHGGRVPPLVRRNREYFRDVFDHLTRFNAILDGLEDTIATAIQVHLSMVTIEQTEVSKRLAAWAGIFAVATAFAGIWGMNFAHMPELDWRYGYPVAIGVIVGCAGLLFWRFRRAGWL